MNFNSTVLFSCMINLSQYISNYCQTVIHNGGFRPPLFPIQTDSGNPFLIIFFEAFISAFITIPQLEQTYNPLCFLFFFEIIPQLEHVWDVYSSVSRLTSIPTNSALYSIFRISFRKGNWMKFWLFFLPRLHFCFHPPL